MHRSQPPSEGPPARPTRQADTAPTVERRHPVATLLGALAFGMVAIFMQGQFLLPPDFAVTTVDFRSPFAATIAPAFAEGFRFTMTQLQMVVLVPLGGWREAWAAWPSGARFELTMLADFGWIASFSYILWRLRRWCLSQLYAVRPRPGRPRRALPGWLHRWVMASLPMLVAGDCVENVSTMLALDLAHGMATWQGAMLWLGSVGSVVKWTGALGCLLLAALGVIRALGPGRP